MDQALPRIIESINERLTALEDQNKRQGEVITKLTLVVEQQAEELERASFMANTTAQALLNVRK